MGNTSYYLYLIIDSDSVHVNSSKQLVKLIGLLNEILLNILKYINIDLVYGVCQASQMSNMLVFYTLNK